MRPHQIMFMGLMLAAGTVISLTFGGAWLGAGDVAITNSLTVFKQTSILGLWSIMLPNVNFFILGFKSLMMMDFAFFNGSMALVQWFLMLTFGLGLLWGVYMAIIYVVQGLFGRH